MDSNHLSVRDTFNLETHRFMLITNNEYKFQKSPSNLIVIEEYIHGAVA
jgi:hypothetical protein